MNMMDDLNHVVGGILTDLYKKNYRFIHPDSSLFSANQNFKNFGLEGVLNLGGWSGLSEEALESELEDIARYGLIAGFKTNFGIPKVVMLIDCTGISDESLVGKLPIIEEKLNNFQKYSSAVGPRPRFSKTKVDCSLFLIFTEQGKANHFKESIWGKLYKRKLFSVHTIFPFVIDIVGRRMITYKGLLHGWCIDENEYARLIQRNPQ
jgi:hypothetical protein